MTVTKDKSTPENRAFRADVERAARIVASWPPWKRGESVRLPSICKAARKREKPSGLHAA